MKCAKAPTHNIIDRANKNSHRETHTYTHEHILTQRYAQPPLPTCSL